MYGLYKQLHPPTAVEHSIYCNFFSSSEKNLVIAGVNQLHVYRLNLNVVSPGQDKSDGKKKQKLELLANFSLFGDIMSMQAVRLAGAVRDSLLLSFRDAKWSLIEYDPSLHDLKTSSLHYYEEYDIKGGMVQHSVFIPHIRVDPDARCAAMLIYGTRLVILPFRRDTGPDDEFSSSSKSQVLSSYIIDLRQLDEKVTNVIDFQFLHGYYEPTIFILHEPLPTFTGRVAVRKDSCSSIAISLNLAEKVHPSIWSLSGLPFDCFRVYPVLKPIGGVLVFADNSLIYMNQSVPPYGVSLNGLTDFSTEFLLKPQEGVKITLDMAQATFIADDKLVISLKGGELYVLTLIVDGMRSVRNFNFDKAAASVLTTCMCICEDGFLFLGSRLGNSLLLKYTEKALDSLEIMPTIKKEPEEPPSKKKKSDSMGEWMASDIRQMDDLDDLEVYGTDMQSSSTSHITSYTFEVCDSILNIGPCGCVVMGEPAFLSEEFSHVHDPDLELVTTSGYGKNGALSVLQRSIRPQVVTTFELPGCQDMWTVIGAPIAEEEKDAVDGAKDDGESHALLIMSTEDSSMVLQTGKEIMELDHSGFSTQVPTIHAGNVGNNKFIIQVTANGVRLLDGVRQIQHIPVDVNSPIVCCSIADPYVIIMSKDGQVMLLTLRPDMTNSDNTRLSIIKPQIHQNSRVQTLCAYKDTSGLFTTRATMMEMDDSVADKKMDMSISFEKSVDDEDELLYGDADVVTTSATSSSGFREPAFAHRPNASQQDSNGNDDSAKKPTYWTALCRENGVLEIYSVPDFNLHFMVKNFPVGHRVLVDSGQTSDQSKSLSDKAGMSDMPAVHELLVVGLGNNKSRPHLMARVDEELYMYEAFPFSTSLLQDRLKIQFKKIPHGLILRKKSNRVKKNDAAEQKAQRVKWLRPFDDISGYAGVFVCGPYPHWLFMSTRGMLRIHPMGIDGWVTCFAQFHNVNCPKGFLYFNKQGELRISVLPTHLSYDSHWPIRKVALRCTPHQVLYHPESKTYTVVTSALEPCVQLCKISPEGEREFETPERAERYIYPTIERFSIQLFSPVSWEAIPNTKIEMEEFEHVTGMKYVMLQSEGTHSGMKGFVAVSTNSSWGEEVTSRGRVIIFDVIEVVPEPGQPLTKNKMKIVYDKEQKGPVSAIDHVHGYLITAIGQKIYIWTLKDNDLSGVAFIDTQIYICSISVIKNLILVGDILKSITLFRYQPERKVLSLVSRDVKPLEVYSTAFMVDGTSLSFVASDRDKNLLVYAYQPEVRESYGGQRLLRKADINIGSHVNSFFRIRCKISDPSSDRKTSSTADKKHINFCATLDGSIGYLLPIAEKVYRRLSMLQNALATHICHVGGLNPKAYRSLQTSYKTLSNPQRNIVDGDLLWKYLNLNILERIEIAKRIGTTMDQLTEDMMEVDRLTAHF